MGNRDDFWNDRTKRTDKILPLVTALVQTWKKDNPNVEITVYPLTYPPRIQLNVVFWGVNTLSDSNLEKLTGLVTDIANLGLKCWKSVFHNNVTYTFRLLFKEEL